MRTRDDMSSSARYVAVEGRRGGFCWQSHASLDALREHFAEGDLFAGAKLSTALAIYMVVTEVANLEHRHGGREGYQARRKLIADRAGVSMRTLDRYVSEIVRAGLLEVEERIVEGVQLPNIWHLVEPPARGDTGVAPRDTGDADPATPVSPGGDKDRPPVVEEPPETTSQVAEEEREERARPRADLALAPAADVVEPPGMHPVEVPVFTYQRKPVPLEVRRAAVMALAEFSAAVGRPAALVDARGGPSPDLRQVAGAMLARPEATLEHWQRAIRAVVASPPGFVDGPLQLGHVFGERAAGHALALGRGERGPERAVSDSDAVLAAARAAAGSTTI